MSLLSKVISNLFNGVSQQPAELRDESQAAVQLNALSSPAYGLRKRPGTTSVAKMVDATQDPLVHFINRDANEQYAVTVTDGDIKVFDAQTGAEVLVSKPQGTAYLHGSDPHTDLRLVSVADHTFVLNTARTVQMKGELMSDTDTLEGTVGFPIPLIRAPVKDPTDSTQTPGPGGSTTSPLPSYGGGGGGWGDPGTGTGTGTGTPTTPKLTDPTNPTKVSLTLALDGGALPAGKVGVAYSAFDLRARLTISGDSGNQGVVTWSTSGVPGGLSVSGGVLSGTPTGKGSFSFSVTATYKGISATRDFSVDITQVVKQTLDPNGNWTDPNAAQTGTTGDPNSVSAWELADSKTRLPGYLGDGDLMARLASQGLTANHYLVLYRPSLTLTVEGDPAASDLRRYFPRGTTTYGGATNTGTLGAFTSTFMPRLYDDRYDLTTFYTNGYYTSATFPKLVLKFPASEGSAFLLDNDIAKTRDAAFYRGIVDGGSVSTVNVVTALAFDATYIIPSKGKWVTDEDGEATMQWNDEVLELPVRVSVTGVRPITPPSPDTFMNMFCGRIEDYYQDGGFLYDPNTFDTTIPIQGFTREIHNYVLRNTNPEQMGVSPLSNLGIGVNSIPYATVGGTPLTYAGVEVSFVPPMAYRIMPKDGLTKAAMGPYVAVLKLYGGNKLVALSTADLAAIP